MRVDDIKVGHKSWAVVGLSLAALVAYAGVSMATVSEVRVGGPRYQEIALNNVLLADVLPPPAYLVESHLTAHRMMSLATLGDTAGLTDAIATLDRLAGEYEARHDFWSEALTDPVARPALLETSYEPAAVYLDVARNQFAPLLETGELEAAKALLEGELQTAYEAHRAGIDQVVARSVEVATATEVAATETATDRGRLLLFLLLAALALVVPLSTIVVRSIVRPVTQLRRRMAEIGDGRADLSQRLLVNRRDEFGQVAESFNGFMVQLQSTVESVEERAGLLIGDSEQLAHVSDDLTAASARSLAQTDVVAGAATEVSAAIDVVVSAAEEMQLAINEIARSATAAASTADQAVAAAAQADLIISRLDQSSVEITQVTNMISTIAEQTNLLALNATIESARAGEAGKGFAVVAHEVKDLSQATAAATGDITDRIERIRTDAESAVAALAQIRQILETMSHSQGMIAAAVEEQTATTFEIARNIERAASSAGAIAMAVDTSVGAASETSSGASTTKEAATRVANAARELQTIVGRFHP